MKPLLTFLLLTLPVLADVKIENKKDHIDVIIDGQPFTTFHIGKDLQKPTLYPLRTADGMIITRQWPMVSGVAGESKDHPHHQGLWLGQKFVNDVNFWENSKGGPGIGTIVLSKLIRAQGGSKSGVIEATFDWLSPEGKPILREDRKMTFYSGSPNRVMDFDFTLTAVNGPVKFGDTKEGTFAIRLNDKMTEKSKGGVLTNAEGATTMKNVWGKPSPWVDYAGTIDGKPVGIAILDHPSSFRHPTRWHARDYGLFAANPFAEKEMTTNKGTTDINYELPAGKSIKLKYRVIIHPGLTADAKIAEEYAKFK